MTRKRKTEGAGLPSPDKRKHRAPVSFDKEGRIVPPKDMHWVPGTRTGGITRDAVLSHVIEYSQENGYGPTLRQICDKLKIKSPSTIHSHIETLEGLGLVTKEDGKSRTISVTPAGLRAMGVTKARRHDCDGTIRRAMDAVAQALECLERDDRAAIERHLSEAERQLAAFRDSL